MCGCTLEVEGILEGETVEVKVPAGCQHAQHIEVEGHGMPRQGSSARGSLVVVVNIVVPQDLSKADLDSLRAIAASRGERVSDKTASHEGFFGKRPGRAASAKKASGERHGK